VNKISLQEILGYTGKSPRFAIALKFPAEEKTTIIRDIILQVGRVGTITPVAIFDKVFLAGTTVSRASLHNEDEIRRLDIRIGDTVVVNKAGDIIPKIVRVLKKLRQKESYEFIFPKKVLGCGGDGSIEKIDGQVAYRCVYMNSPELLEKRLSYFVSKNCFNIEGLSSAILRTFIEKRLVIEPADIFKLKEDDIKFLEGFGEKSAKNIILEISKKKEVELDRFIASLSIESLGRETAILLAKEFKN
jgi:DNA ligase (NAD+)